jgi:cysteate synthase
MSFIQVCSEKGIPIIVFTPASALPSMWITREKHPAVVFVVLKGEADFYDAIELANTVAEQDNFYSEGAAKNVARRDGMGTVVLTAAEATGRIPDHYFQAVGSGTGGIAAWEMSNRLLGDGRFGNHKMRLHFVQNEPFTIIADAWQQQSPELLPLEEKEARSRLAKVYATILSNRKPPYSISGGVFDALLDTSGFTYTVTNSEAKESGYLFEKLEGCDLHPAAEVTVAGLRQAVEMGRIGKKDYVLLNLTGGGIKKIEKEGIRIPLEPDFLVTKEEISVEALADQVREYQKIKTS